ncbi:MAG: thioredoxin [Dehalococcoidia bacterium]|nr:thioredoxin [Dehalococcoidia bacterium]
MVNEVTDQTFDSEVLKSTQPVLVDMWAPWCGPCRQVRPILEKLSVKYQGKVKFCALNVDDNPRTPAQYRVMSIPNMLFIKDGKVVDTVIGSVPESALTTKIEAMVNSG